MQRAIRQIALTLRPLQATQLRMLPESLPTAEEIRIQEQEG